MLPAASLADRFLVCPPHKLVGWLASLRYVLYTILRNNDCQCGGRGLVRAVSTTSLKNNGMLMMESLRINEIEPKNLKKEVIFYEISELIVLSGNGIQASTSFLPVPIETGIEVK